jgi:hypothetical protein
MLRNEKRNVQTQYNWFSRFARALGSSLSMLGAGASASTLSSLPGESQNLSSPHKTSVSHSALKGKSETADSSTRFRSEDESKESKESFSVVQISQNGSTETNRPRPFPIMVQASSMRPIEGRQRLAGHITKVRLEAPPVPETPSPMQWISETPREILDVSSLSRFPIAPAKSEINVCSPQPTNEETALSQLLTRDVINKTVVGSQKSLPTSRMFKGHVRIPARNPLYGSGEFKCGQRDVVIKNPAVRETSVILVTLTSNPGPVVVQYVSLLPYESFTVHLTAPTTMHTRFNYIIFSDELT